MMNNTFMGIARIFAPDEYIKVIKKRMHINNSSEKVL